MSDSQSEFRFWMMCGGVTTSQTFCVSHSIHNAKCYRAPLPNNSLPTLSNQLARSPAYLILSRCSF